MEFLLWMLIGLGPFGYLCCVGLYGSWTWFLKENPQRADDHAPVRRGHRRRRRERTGAGEGGGRWLIDSSRTAAPRSQSRPWSYRLWPAADMPIRRRTIGLRSGKFRASSILIQRPELRMATAWRCLPRLLRFMSQNASRCRPQPRSRPCTRTRNSSLTRKPIPGTSTDAAEVDASWSPTCASVHTAERALS